MLMKIDGSCHCGRVTYEAEVDPGTVSICHCTDCQQLTGSPYRVSVRAHRDDLRLTGALAKCYVKFGDNGRRRLQFFCGDCGSPMMTTGEGEDAAVWGLRWGTIRQRVALTPKSQIWCRSAAPWVAGIKDLPATETD